MRPLKKGSVFAAIALAVVVGFGGNAGATPPAGYGFDNTAEVIVGGGSDTTYKAMQGLADLWEEAPGCQVVTAVGATLNQCLADANPETNTLGNYQRDTIAQANPVGSSAGVASLLGQGTYAGTVTGTVDFARSSRGPKTTGGPTGCTNELTCATFWGFGQDGIEVVVYNDRNVIQGAGGNAITSQDLVKIWNCTYNSWADIPGLGIAPGSPEDGPLVPMGMNASAGTFASFQTYLISEGGAPPGFNPNAGACVKKLSNGTFSLENDIKYYLFDQRDNGGLSNDPASVRNPENWIWWSSFGQLSAYPYTSSVDIDGTNYSAFAAPVNGILPSHAGILANTYPIGRTVYHVTKKADADCAKTAGACDFVGNPGPAIPSTGVNDLNVTGAVGGKGGAIREFTRWICRSGASRHAVDPYSGVNYAVGIAGAIAEAGFTAVPVALRTPGSACRVLS